MPERLNNPFEYAPHPLAVLAAEQVKSYVGAHSEWAGELACGKMLGVLVVSDASGELGFLAAYSGILAGSNSHDYFVPPIYDLLTPNGEFKQGEAQISAINAQIAQLESSDSLRMAKRALQEAEEAKTTAINAYKLTMSEAKANREAR
ncbi:MAG TPA: RNA pseudouridine synthase, partial [Porphyromonadaceae bacterium]|nr:RNA pseudouridine synthase [Porphyromonadaceae bacterium]